MNLEGQPFYSKKDKPLCKKHAHAVNVAGPRVAAAGPALAAPAADNEGVKDLSAGGKGGREE